jgi:putative membrane protein
MITDFDPYCGPAPQPATFWSSWNFDPWLIPAYVAIVLICFVLSPLSRVSRSNMRWNAAALVLFLAAFVSPLCALSTALFSARIAHHMLLVAAIAPALALAFPARRSLARLPASAVFLAHTVLFWIWHAPTPYAFALSSHAAYWLMEGTLLISAFVMWQRILAPATHPGTALAMLLGSIIQMGMLGALLTFAGQAMFEPHLTTTVPFGLTPLGDQQLAGLIMWVPSALPYLLCAVIIGMRLLEGGAGRRSDGAAAG